MTLKEKIIQHFEGKVVRKDLTSLVKGSNPVPVYVLEYLLGQYCAIDDEEVINAGIEKVRNVGNKLDANFPNNFEVFEKKYTSRNAYDNFSTLNDIKPQKEYYAVVIPDYVNITYSCIVSTYYVEQLNKIVEAVNYASDAYWGDPERYKFRVKIDTINTPTELTQDSIRLVKANFNMVLNGQVVPDLIQKDLSAINKFFNKTKTIFSIETVSQIPK